MCNVSELFQAMTGHWVGNDRSNYACDTGAIIFVGIVTFHASSVTGVAPGYLAAFALCRARLPARAE